MIKSAPFRPYPRFPKLRGLTSLEKYISLAKYSKELSAWVALHDVNGYTLHNIRVLGYSESGT